MSSYPFRWMFGSRFGGFENPSPFRWVFGLWFGGTNGRWPKGKAIPNPPHLSISISRCA